MQPQQWEEQAPAAGVPHGSSNARAAEDGWLAELDVPALGAPVVEPPGQWEPDALPATGNWDEWNEFLATVAEQPRSTLVPDAAALPFNEGDEGLLNFEDDQVATDILLLLSCVS